MVALNEQLVIRISAETRRKLEQRAEKEDRTVSQMARVILERALRKEK